MMMPILAVIFALFSLGAAFTPPAVLLLQQRAPRTFLTAVTDIGNEASFDKAIKSANGLVVVDYSTTWCGPCKGEF